MHAKISTVATEDEAPGTPQSSCCAPAQPCPAANPVADAASCEQAAERRAAELAQINETLETRERLLAATAQASRLLLEAVDVQAAVPDVLRLLGEAADVDRVSLLRCQLGPVGERLLVVTAEWVAEGLAPHLGHEIRGFCNESNYQHEATQLRAGQSVCIYKEEPVESNCFTLEGRGTRSKAIVPIFLDREFIGVVGFDNTRQRRAVNSAELSALETAAGVIGAALHRERLVDAVRRERERAAEERVAALTERNRIGQEIHDGLAQAFTGILMQLGAAEELQAFDPRSSLSVILGRIRDITREGLSEARRSVLALDPERSRRGGLPLALRQLAQRSTIPNKVSCTFKGTDTITGLAPEHEHELLRITQEAVSNAVRHARPSTVCISITEEGAHWVLSVTDDGCGMEDLPELYTQQGFGLTNMRERALAIGGQWQITSKLKSGTRVSVRLPKRTVQ